MLGLDGYCFENFHLYWKIGNAQISNSQTWLIDRKFTEAINPRSVGSKQLERCFWMKILLRKRFLDRLGFAICPKDINNERHFVADNIDFFRGRTVSESLGIPGDIWSVRFLVNRDCPVSHQKWKIMTGRRIPLRGNMT